MRRDVVVPSERDIAVVEIELTRFGKSRSVKLCVQDAKLAIVAALVGNQHKLALGRHYAIVARCGMPLQDAAQLRRTAAIGLARRDRQRARRRTGCRHIQHCRAGYRYVTAIEINCPAGRIGGGAAEGHLFTSRHNFPASNVHTIRAGHHHLAGWRQYLRIGSNALSGEIQPASQARRYSQHHWVSHLGQHHIAASNVAGAGAIGGA